MFQRVLIAEDYQSSSLAVRTALDELHIIHEPRYHCDDALTAIRKGLQTDDPFDLLITDLSFEPEKGRKPEIAGGAELIKAVRQLQPGLKVLVFSIDNRLHAIESLFDDQGINGYVIKGRSDLDHLKEAVLTIWKGSRYRPAGLRQAIRQDSHYKPTDFDIAILTLLQTVNQKEIPSHLREMRIKPCSLSSVEKRLSFLKEKLECPQNTQLLLLCKERGYI